MESTDPYSATHLSSYLSTKENNSSLTCQCQNNAYSRKILLTKEVEMETQRVPGLHYPEIRIFLFHYFVGPR